MSRFTNFLQALVPFRRKSAINLIHAEAEGVRVSDALLSQLADTYKSESIDVTYKDYSVSADVLSRLYALNPLIAGIVDMKASALAGTELRVRRNKDGVYLTPLIETELNQGLEQDLFNLFIRADSREYPLTKLIMDINVSLDVFGTFIVVADVDNDGHKVLYCLNPLFVEIVPSSTGRKIDSIKYEVANHSAVFSENRVLIGTNPNFSDNVSGFYYGQSKIRANVSSGQGVINSIISDSTRFKSGDQYPLIIKVNSNIGADNLKVLQKSIKARKPTDSQTVVLPEEAEVIPSLSYSYQRINSKEFREDAIKQYALSLGVPIRLIDPSSTTDIEQLTTLWWETSLLARKKYIEELFTAKFCSQYNASVVSYSVVLDHTNLSWYVTKALNLTRIAVAQLNAGIITVNEARTVMFGLPKLPETFKNASYADTPKPVYDAQVQTDRQSTSTNLPGSLGGRDQSADGETELIDESGRR